MNSNKLVRKQIVKRKLTLRIETVKALTQEDLRKIVGGSHAQAGCTTGEVLCTDQ